VSGYGEPAKLAPWQLALIGLAFLVFAFLDVPSLAADPGEEVSGGVRFLFGAVPFWIGVVFLWLAYRRRRDRNGE
jgi:uncharacterized sodium:solute symporter family permease YidK